MSAAFSLEACREVLGLQPQELLARLDLANAEVREGLRYEGMSGLTMYYNPERFAGRIYVREGKVAIVYVPSGEELRKTSPVELARQLHGKPADLRSRAGKEFTHHVYAEQGVAFSDDDEAIRFVEVFPPRSLDAYKREIYRDPGPFIR